MANSYIYTRCITLRNGKQLCKPQGQVFRFKANDNYKPKKVADGPPKRPDQEPDKGAG